jgi:hypothetical protein
MTHELISKRTRNQFREHLVGSTLREIQMAFDAADIAPNTTYQPKESGQRRGLVEQYYASIDFTNHDDVRKLLQVYEGILTELPNRPFPAGPQNGQAAKSLETSLRRDGFVFENGHLIPSSGSYALSSVKAKAVELDAEHLAGQIKRIEHSIDSDPAQAIGSAKELLETCCKTILAERGKESLERLDVQPLVRRTMEELQLVPEGVPEEAKGARTIKALLGNLASIGQNLAELRNLYGTGHGKNGRTKGLSPRHARLAVGAAITLVVFLFDTHKER